MEVMGHALEGVKLDSLGGGLRPLAPIAGIPQLPEGVVGKGNSCEYFTPVWRCTMGLPGKEREVVGKGKELFGDSVLITQQTPRWA